MESTLAAPIVVTPALEMVTSPVMATAVAMLEPFPTMIWADVNDGEDTVGLERFTSTQ